MSLSRPAFIASFARRSCHGAKPLRTDWGSMGAIAYVCKDGLGAPLQCGSRLRVDALNRYAGEGQPDVVNDRSAPPRLRDAANASAASPDPSSHGTSKAVTQQSLQDLLNTICDI